MHYTIRSIHFKALFLRCLVPTDQNNIWTARAVSELCHKPPVAGIQFVTVRRNNWTVRVSFLHLIKYWSVWCPDNHTASQMLSAPFQVHGEAGSLLGALWLEMISDASGPVGFWECTKSVLPLDCHTILKKKACCNWLNNSLSVSIHREQASSVTSLYALVIPETTDMFNECKACLQTSWMTAQF